MPHSPRSRLPVRAGRGVTIRDFVVFQIKLAADGVKDVVAINLSIIAIIIDLLAGRGARPRFFYGVVRLSRRFESWLRLHRMKGLPDHDGGEDRIGPPAANADDIIASFETVVQRKASEMRARDEPAEPAG